MHSGAAFFHSNRFLLQMRGGEATLDQTAVYRGRFAPSPTGPLHFGSLVAAVGSYLDARAAGGWCVWRTSIASGSPRCCCYPAYLRDLRIRVGRSGTLARRPHSGLCPGHRTATRCGIDFPCACSRREIAANGLPGIEGPVYPGTCCHRPPPGKGARSLRLRTDGGTMLVRDRVQGTLRQDLARVVDDGFQGINHIVRGTDLLASTPRQSPNRPPAFRNFGPRPAQRRPVAVFGGQLVR